MQQIIFTKTLKIGKINKTTQLATEVYEFFQKQLSYPQICGLIKQKGSEGVYWAMNEVKQEGAKNPIAKFLYLIKQQHIEFKEI